MFGAGWNRQFQEGQEWAEAHLHPHKQQDVERSWLTLQEHIALQTVRGETPVIC